MADEIWVSSVGSNSQLFDRPGIREKHFGEDWAPPQFAHDAPTAEQLENMHRCARGEKLKRDEFVEAAYVFDQKRWSRVKDFFAVDGFFAVKGRLAELLKQFDLGDGELTEFPIYETDKVTQLPGPFYFLNFGTQKHCFLPEESQNMVPGPQHKVTGFRRYRNLEPADGDIAISASALDGADLWADPILSGKFLMSGRLHDAIEAAKLGIDFSFARARIIYNSEAS